MYRKTLFFMWFGLILLLSIAPNGSGDRSVISAVSLTQSGFFLHLIGYFILTALACLAFQRKRLLLCLVSIILLGVFLEGVQFYLPYRTFNWNDVVANGIGILSFVVIWVLFKCKVYSL